jgi:hypothetical protein
MMKRSPEQTMKALAIHNAVIRRAKYVNCGFTLEQEGDSYIIVFKDTLDAVAFCLQVCAVQLGTITHAIYRDL